MSDATPLGEVLRAQRELHNLSTRHMADLLYEQTGRAKPRDDPDQSDPPAVEAIRTEPRLTTRQRQALLEIYDSFTGRRQPRRSS